MNEYKPFSQACEENKVPIRDVLAPYLDGARSLLEIGSGTGQHALFMAAAFPWLRWQASDVPRYLPGIRVWTEEAGLRNLPAPIPLEVTRGPWPQDCFDAVFSANTAHIMSAYEAELMVRGVAQVLVPGGVFALYGPFNYGGRFTSESNARFELWLKAQDPNSGVKDFETLDQVAGEVGLALIADHEMPVNNRTLVWRRAA